MGTTKTPTLYEWAGGQAALDRLTTRFYERVKDDALLAPVFAHMSGDHPHHVALFLAEVLGGPTAYSEQHGGHAHMVSRHLSRHLSQAAAPRLGRAAARHRRRARHPRRSRVPVGDRRLPRMGLAPRRDQLGVRRERDRAGHADARRGAGARSRALSGLNATGRRVTAMGERAPRAVGRRRMPRRPDDDSPRLALTLAFAPAIAAARHCRPGTRRARQDCSAPEHHQFDFWLGTWNVTVAGQAGRHEPHRSVMNGCGVLEHWTSAAAATAPA
jgi:truncated hemoglobin YjbI